MASSAGNQGKGIPFTASAPWGHLSHLYSTATNAGSSFKNGRRRYLACQVLWQLLELGSATVPQCLTKPAAKPESKHVDAGRAGDLRIRGSQVAAAGFNRVPGRRFITGPSAWRGLNASGGGYGACIHSRTVLCVPVSLAGCMFLVRFREERVCLGNRLAVHLVLWIERRDNFKRRCGPRRVCAPATADSLTLRPTFRPHKLLQARATGLANPPKQLSIHPKALLCYTSFSKF